MNKNEIALLFRYNSWANTRILSAAAKVTGEQFLAPAAFPHGGLRSTLTHTLFAEWVWRKRLEGDSPTHMIEPEEFPSFGSLHDRWLKEDSSLMAFVESFTDARLNAELAYKTIKGEPKQNIVWQLMAHMVNHGTDHRAQALHLLHNLGAPTFDQDFILWLPKK